MTEVAFFVEGFMEQDFIKRVCPKSKVRRIELNGKHVSSSDMADRIYALISPLAHRCHNFIILFDLEKRKVKHNLFIDMMRSELTARIGCEVDFIVGVADYKIENWILASPTAIRRYFDIDWEHQNYDGVSADKIFLKEIGKKIDKRIEGPKLLELCLCSEIQEVSPSARDFFQSIEVDCWWLNR